MFDSIKKIVEYFATNPLLIGITSISGIIGSIISIYLMITTSKIKTILQRYRQIENFNSKNKYYKSRFSAYKDLILENKILDKKLTSDILTDLLTYRNNYFMLLGYIDKLKINYIAKHLEKDIVYIDKNKLCNQLSYLISKLNKKEFDY